VQSHYRCDSTLSSETPAPPPAAAAESGAAACPVLPASRGPRLIADTSFAIEHISEASVSNGGTNQSLVTSGMISGIISGMISGIISDIRYDDDMMPVYTISAMISDTIF
jgi:hypothetical protein